MELNFYIENSDLNYTRYCDLVSQAGTQPAAKRKSDNSAIIIHSIMGLSQSF